MLKLGSSRFREDSLAQLAALDCRVLIRYDPLNTKARTTQADLIKTYMRVVFNIDGSRDSMWSGYPSEPVLAEAAARLLNSEKGPGIVNYALQILNASLNTGLLARGERGEMVARTFFTVAHDLAIKEQYQPSPTSYFHRPIRLVDLLKHLLASDVWAIVKNAYPVHHYPGDLTLEEAFANAWVNFSHFVQLGDHKSFTLECASELLKRGAAIQCFDNQYNQDGALPVLHGDPSTTEINEENTSVLQFQVKNAAHAVNVSPDPKLVGASKRNLPIISITMQLGIDKDNDIRVRVHTTKKGSDVPAGRTRSSFKSLPTHIDRRHYSISLFGCTAKTYGCVPTDGGYHRVLKSRRLYHDFPRVNDEQNVASLYALKPFIYMQGGIFMPWSSREEVIS